MRARKRSTDPTITPVLLDDAQAAARYSIGVCNLRKIADAEHAVVRIGRLRRNNVLILDAYFGISTPPAE